MSKTVGEKRLGVSYNNMSHDSYIVFSELANVIARMEKLTVGASGDVKRLVALGNTAVEQAALWYNKALEYEQESEL